MRSLFLVVALLMAPVSVWGQAGADLNRASGQSVGPGVSDTGQSGPGFTIAYADQAEVVHLPNSYCGTDFSSEEERRALDAFLKARRSGTLRRAAKHATVPELGEIREFRILDQYGTPQQRWLAKDFELIDKEPGKYYLWVDLDAKGFIDASDTAVLRSGLALQTPTGSVDPGRGIIDNNRTYFGMPPDFDGDGTTDILLYDITASGVGGFVTSQDVDPSAPDSVGNQADVLHLDAPQSSFQLAAIAAHEYTHLQNITYGWDDFTFVTEGYAEYAMVMNGYVTRTIDYLTQTFEAPGADLYEYTRPLFDWRVSPSNGGPSARDYQRGGLFFTYIANQIGPESVGGMLRGERKGVNGIDSVLVELGDSLNGIIRDFHTANLVNNANLDPRFGYFRQGRRGLRASPSRIIDGEARYVGPEGPQYAVVKEDEPITTGSVHYIQFNNVARVDLIIDSANYQQIASEIARERERQFQQNNLLVRVYGLRPDGTPIVYDISANADYQQFNGSFEFLTLMVAHTARFNGKYRYDVSWTPLSQIKTGTEDPTIPASTVLSQNYPNPFNPTTTVSFDLPLGGNARLTVFDLLGREIAVIDEGWFSAGRHTRVIDATQWASGQYFYRLESAAGIQTRSMMLIR